MTEHNQLGNINLNYSGARSFSDEHQSGQQGHGLEHYDCDTTYVNCQCVMSFCST